MIRKYINIILFLLPICLSAQFAPGPTFRTVLGSQTTNNYNLISLGDGAPSFTPVADTNARIYIDTSNTLLYQYTVGGGWVEMFSSYEGTINNTTANNLTYWDGDSWENAPVTYDGTNFTIGARGVSFFAPIDGGGRYGLKFGSDGVLDDNDDLMLTNRAPSGDLLLATSGLSGGGGGETTRITIGAISGVTLSTNLFLESVSNDDNEGQILAANSITGEVKYVSKSTITPNLWSETGSDIYYNSGLVGIGTTIPEKQIHLVSEDVTDRGFIMDFYRDGTAGNTFVARKAAGSIASPTIVADNDLIGAYAYEGYDGTKFLSQVSFFGGIVTGTPTVDTVPTAIYFVTGSISGSADPSGYDVDLLIHPNGNTGIGDWGNVVSGLDAPPSYKLDVLGTGHFTSDLTLDNDLLIGSEFFYNPSTYTFSLYNRDTTNAIIGYNSGNSAGGTFNTIFGTGAGRNNTGTSNTFIGRQAGEFNTDGFWNTFIGRLAGANNAGGDYNTAIGREALENAVNADFNTGVGYAAGTAITSGTSNTILGAGSGTGITTSTGNTILGRAMGTAAISSYNIFIGHSLAGSASDTKQLRIGANGEEWLNGSFTGTSDYIRFGNYKFDIDQDTTSLDGQALIFENGEIALGELTPNLDLLPDAGSITENDNVAIQTAGVGEGELALITDVAAAMQDYTRNYATTTDSDPNIATVFSLNDNLYEYVNSIAVTASATSDSQATLPTPSASYINKEITIIGFDAHGTYNVTATAGGTNILEAGTAVGSVTIAHGATAVFRCAYDPLNSVYTWVLQ